MAYVLMWIFVNLGMYAHGIRLDSVGFWIAQAVFIVGRFLIID